MRSFSTSHHIIVKEEMTSADVTENLSFPKNIYK